MKKGLYDFVELRDYESIMSFAQKLHHQSGQSKKIYEEFLEVFWSRLIVNVPYESETTQRGLAVRPVCFLMAQPHIHDRIEHISVTYTFSCYPPNSTHDDKTGFSGLCSFIARNLKNLKTITLWLSLPDFDSDVQKQVLDEHKPWVRAFREIEVKQEFFLDILLRRPTDKVHYEQERRQISRAIEALLMPLSLRPRTTSDVIQTT